MTITDHDIANAMVRYGGSFISALGQAWLRADQHNGDRIKAAFAEEWQTYEELARMQARRKGEA